MKILYISHFDSTGYGRASKDLVLSMDSVNLNVVPRPFILNNTKPELTGRLLELAQQDSSGCDTVIFHTLPHFIERGDFKRHICYFAAETSNFDDANWAKYLNLMDEVWCINNDQKRACFDSGVTVPIKVVHHACNTERYNKEHQKLQLPIPENQVVFYTIGDFARRKNLVALVKAFHLEFDRISDNIQLLIKTNKAGVDSNELSKAVGEFCNEIKKGLKLYVNLSDYKPELILTEHLNDDQLLALHNVCDIYVNSSLGEGWCLPLFDACAMGNLAISSDNGGPSDYIPNYEDGTLCATYNENCFAGDNMANMYTGREEWGQINIESLRRSMRHYYNICMDKKGNKVREKNMVAGRDFAELYSYNKIGNLIKSILEN